MTQDSPSPETRKKSTRGMALIFAAYYVIALLLLRQWRESNRWARLDIFAGGHLFIGILWGIATLRFARAIARTPAVLREASGSGYDKAFLIVVSLLSATDFLVYLDYGHLHLIPALEKPWLQGAGLALSLGGALCLFWVDSHLMKHFSDDQQMGKIMSDGPYAFVRHPRYAVLLLSRVALALALASVFAWIFAIAWLLAILHRVQREEQHLRELFGEAYEGYTRRTRRLLPGLY